MINMRTGNLVSLVSICIFSLTGCDPTTFTSYFLENHLNEEIRIYIKFSDMSIVQTDTTILLEPQQEILYSNVEKIGREDYQEFDEFIQLYDSIVAIRSDTIFSKNLIDQSEWIFTIRDDNSAEYRLIINDQDF